MLHALSSSAPALLPEAIVCLGLVVVLVAGLWPRWRSHLPMLAGVSALTLAAALGVLASGWGKASPGTSLFLGQLRHDGPAHLVRIAVAAAGLATIGLAGASAAFRQQRQGQAEFFPLLLGMVLGGMLLAGASHLLLVYLSLELLGVCSYVLAAWHRGSPQGAEAGLKYMLYGAFSSAIMLFGMSLLYGVTGTMDIGSAAFAGGLNPGPNMLLFAVGLVMVFAGLSYKISAVPFHFWTPDVYQGALSAIAAFFSMGPKAAGLAVVWRMASALAPNPHIAWVLGVAALATMFLGNLAAFGQTNFRRMLGYSSIAHTGYSLAGLALLNDKGYAAVFFYLLLYLVMNLAAFAFADALESATGTGNFRQWQGMGWQLPVHTAAFIVALVALTGLPPTAGFIGKLNLLVPAWDAAITSSPWYWALVGGLALNTVLSLFYYLAPALYLLRRPLAAATDDPELASVTLPPDRLALARPQLWLLLPAGIALLWLGVFHFGGLLAWVQSAF